ncbi:hypothetical protein HY636_01680 [Candidatus Woesearchaeota archaeon]|nr:hypothetical protein [Candidatus Woesearchaeota archaeon]
MSKNNIKKKLENSYRIMLNEYMVIKAGGQLLKKASLFLSIVAVQKILMAKLMKSSN